MEVIPYTLAENAGLSPIITVTELRNQHAQGKKDFGVNVRKGYVTDIKEENVLQPLLVTSYAIKQAAECVRSILKIDDIVSCLLNFIILAIFSGSGCPLNIRKNLKHQNRSSAYKPYTILEHCSLLNPD
jgi:hypothetical protein